jgi:hypothetical protein
MDENDLSQYAEIMNQYGIDSPEAEAFFAERAADDEFVRLARLSRRLKVMLMVMPPEPVREAPSPQEAEPTPRLDSGRPTSASR